MNFIKKFYSFLSKTLKKVAPFSELLFFLAILFLYTPFFIYCKVPVINWDTWAYLLMAQDFTDGNIPIHNYIADFPYGLPFVIFFFYKLGLSLISVVFFQVVISVAVGIFLINQVKKIAIIYGFFASLFLIVFMASSEIMLHNTMIYTESLYTSGIIIVSASLLGLYRTKSWKFIFLMGVGISIMIFTRSNGLYILFLPLALIFFSFLNTDGLSFKILLMFFSVLLVNASANLYVKGYFMPGEMNRIISKVETAFQKVDPTTIDTSKLDSFAINRINPNYKNNQRYKVIVNLSNSDMGNYYYYKLPIYISAYLDSTTLHSFVANNIVYKKDFNVAKIVNYMYFNVNLNDGKYKQILNTIDINAYPRNKWLYANHLVHLLRVLWRNIIILLLYYFSIILIIYQYFKNKEVKEKRFWEMLFLLTCIHLFSISYFVLSPPRDTSLMRYCIVTEVLAYLTIVLCYGKLIKDYLLRRSQ